MFVKKCTLGNDASVRFTTSGDAVASVSLAYNYGKKVDGKYPTQWIDVALWGKRAESTAQYLLKGTQIVAVVKDLHVETYDKKDGKKGVKLVGNLDDFEFCGVKSVSSDQAEKPARQDAAPKEKPASMDNFDDDIPFAFHGMKGAGVDWRAM